MQDSSKDSAVSVTEDCVSVFSSILFICHEEKREKMKQCYQLKVEPAANP